MKPHLLFWVRPDTEHRKVGSWIEAIDDPSLAGPPFQADVDRVLSRYAGGWLVAHEYDPARVDDWSAEEKAFGLDRKFRLVGLSGRPIPNDLVVDLRALAVVERVDPGLVAATPLPSASSMSARPSGWAGRLVGLDEAHRETRGSQDVTIAVLDTGVDTSHPEYRARLLPGFDFVDIIEGADSFPGDRLDADPDPSDPGVGHASHVTGILVARGDRMPTGVAPSCSVLPVRVLGALKQDNKVIGAGLVDNINAGIKFAVDHGADVINMSLGIRREGGGLPHIEVVRYAEQRGSVVVAAAGNDGNETLYYPGALPGVIAVGAVGPTGEVPPYSTWGDQVDVVAPGTEIWSSWLDGGYAFATGTSQATPFVAGAAALCQSLARSAGRSLTAAQTNDVLGATADRDDRQFKTLRAGRGRLNIPDALRLTAHRLERARDASGNPNRPRAAPDASSHQPDWKRTEDVMTTISAKPAGASTAAVSVKRDRVLQIPPLPGETEKVVGAATQALAKKYAGEVTKAEGTIDDFGLTIEATRLRDRLTRSVRTDLQRLLLSTPGVTEALFNKAIEAQLKDETEPETSVQDASVTGISNRLDAVVDVLEKVAKVLKDGQSPADLGMVAGAAPKGPPTQPRRRTAKPNVAESVSVDSGESPS